MKIKITCNIPLSLVLDTLTGMVSGIPEGKNCTDIGYLHLLCDHEYTPDEQREICRINTLYFADAWKPWSEYLMTTTADVKRPWHFDEKKLKMEEILAKPITGISSSENEKQDFWDSMVKGDSEPIDQKLWDCWTGNAFESIEDRDRAIQEVMLRDYVLENKKTTTQRLSLGGSFQRFYADFYAENEDWLKEAERIKGDTIFLA
jgi:hypothetical protein